MICTSAVIGAGEVSRLTKKHRIATISAWEQAQTGYAARNYVVSLGNPKALNERLVRRQRKDLIIITLLLSACSLSNAVIAIIAEFSSFVLKFTAKVYGLRHTPEHSDLFEIVYGLNYTIEVYFSILYYYIYVVDMMIHAKFQCTGHLKILFSLKNYLLQWWPKDFFCYTIRKMFMNNRRFSYSNGVTGLWCRGGWTMNTEELFACTAVNWCDRRDHTVRLSKGNKMTKKEWHRQRGS